MKITRGQITAAVVILILVGVFLLTKKSGEAPTNTFNPRNSTFTIEGKRVTLVDGVAESPAAPGSATKVVTRYFGNDLHADINSDGREDLVYLVTQDSGGSGTFYYVVAALNLPAQEGTEAGYVGSQGYLLGDRIAPQTIEMSQNPLHKDVVVVSYADRALGEPMTTQPSVGKSVWLKLDTQNMLFGTVVQNFEGESR